MERIRRDNTVHIQVKPAVFVDIEEAPQVRLDHPMLLRNFRPQLGKAWKRRKNGYNIRRGNNRMVWDKLFILLDTIHWDARTLIGFEVPHIHDGMCIGRHRRRCRRRCRRRLVYVKNNIYVVYHAFVVAVINPRINSVIFSIRSERTRGVSLMSSFAESSRTGQPRARIQSS